jgi:hypothetical protein
MSWKAIAGVAVATVATAGTTAALIVRSRQHGQQPVAAKRK